MSEGCGSMGKQSINFEQVLPYDIEDVYESVLDAVEHKWRFRIKKKMPLTHTIYVRAKMGIFTNGENMIVALSETAFGHTQITMSSVTGFIGSAWADDDLSRVKNQRNIQKLMAQIAKELEHCTQVPPRTQSTTVQISAAKVAKQDDLLDKIEKLKRLLDSGDLSIDEYDKAKKKLLE